MSRLQGNSLDIPSMHPARVPTPVKGFHKLFRSTLDGSFYVKDSGSNIIPIAFKGIDLGGTTTDAVQKEIFVDNTPGIRITVPVNTSLLIQAFFMGVRKGGTAAGTVGSTGFTQLGIIVKNVGGVCTVVSGAAPTPLSGDAEAAAWIVDLQLDASLCVIKALVTGEANKVIEFTAKDVYLATVDFNS